MVKVAVVGAGAMGSLFGGFLSEHGHDVTCIDVWAEHVEALNRDGLRIEGVSGDRVVPLKAVTDPARVGPVDLIIIFVKAYHTEGAVKAAKPMLGSDTMVVTFQNGLGNIEAIERHVPRAQILGGVTSWGATMLGPGRVRHAGVGDSFVGELDGAMTTRLQVLSEAFTSSGIVLKPTDNILGLLWSKLLVNIGINALTAILRVHNGRLVQYPGSDQLLALAVSEAVEVAKAKGIRLLYGEPVAKVRDVCGLTAQNRSSMLQDVLAGRRTEIDFINGAIVREGEALGVHTPVNLVLTQIVKTIEQTYDIRVS